jgi:polyhydroxybutyrate depolymerase
MIASPASLRFLTAPALLGALLLAAACSSSNGGNTGGSGGAGTTSSTGSDTTSSTSTGSAMRPPDPPIDVDLQGRMYDLKLPANYDPNTPAPLFLELHGFTNGPAPWDGEEAANNFAPEADKRGMIFVLPHGSYDPTIDKFFWNATNSCCDLDMMNTNDIGYIAAIVKDVKSKYKIDEKRIFAFGHSNGGFMVNRIACDMASTFAGVVSLAGATYKDQTKCAASAPIAYLQVHGDADMTVPYAGGHPENVSILPIAPGAVETTQDWAAKNNCNPMADTKQPPIDIVADLDGAETNKLVYNECEANGHTELWTIHLGVHSPNFNQSWAPAVFDFLTAHPKP